jgi:hypothetical protein
VFGLNGISFDEVFEFNKGRVNPKIDWKVKKNFLC